MPGVKLFRREDQDLSFDGNLADESYCISAFVNASNSETMGGGFGVFGAGSNVEWTVTYDEFLFIHSGRFQLKIGEDIFHAGPGDSLWIPKDTHSPTSQRKMYGSSLLYTRLVNHRRRRYP
jgi:ethanolamine utilization protein EutQ (cupin superfamily)